MDTDLVLFEQRAGVAYLTLNRPAQFNALSENLLKTLIQHLDAIAGDGSLRVVVLGANGKAFCPGHDLREMRAQPSQAYYQQLFGLCSKMMLKLQALPQPVIARVQGIATAAGCQLVGMCDMAVASDDARFAVSGVNLGLFCATPSVALSRNIGRKAAFEMLFTGQFISAQEAQRLGLVNRVVAAEQLDTVIEELTSAIIAKPAAAIAAGKGLFYRQAELGIDAAYQLAGHTMACNMMNPSALEGVQAFLEKRPPNWSK
jgi:enoyl-CoA hydratase/carnithine racemase